MLARSVQTAFRSEHWSEHLNAEHLLSEQVNSGHVLCLGGLVLSVGGLYSLLRASAVFVFLCCTRVLGACGAEVTAANKGVTTLRAFGAPP